MKTYRQGDVLLIKLDCAKLNRDKAKRIEPDPDRGVVLAYGEVTGHAHELDPQICTLFAAEPNVLDGDGIDMMLAQFTGGQVRGLSDSDRILSVRTDTTLRHTLPGGGPSGDHDSIPIEAGVYVVRRQREYDPEMERLVAD